MKNFILHNLGSDSLARKISKLPGRSHVFVITSVFLEV